MSDIFEHFQRKQSFGNNFRSVQQVFFQINFDELGAHLSVVNQKGDEVEVSYLKYSGVIRNVLRSIDQIREKNSFIIDWEKQNEHIYFAEYEYLIDQLRHCKVLVDSEMKPIRFTEGVGKIRISVEKIVRGSKLAILHYRSKVYLDRDGVPHRNFTMLNESTALVHSQLIEIKPLGSQFINVKHFNTEIRETDLTVFFSLLFSNLEQVDLQFEDYTVKNNNESINASPSLIFEKVDIDDSLFMRIGHILPDVAAELLQQFDLYRFAEINEIEKTISVKIIEQGSIEELSKGMLKKLRRHIPRTKRKELGMEIVQNDNLFIIPKDVAAEFIYNELPTLLATFKIFGAEKLKAYKITTKAPSVSLKLSHDIDFFEGDVSLDFEGESHSLFDVISQYKKQNYILLNDGTHALLNESYLRKLERIFKKKGEKVRLSFFDLPLVDELIEGKTTGDTFKRSREIFSGFNDINSNKTRLPKINAELRPYQKQGYKWLRYLQDNKLGGCLADDMGLGKTLQTIALLASSYAKKQKPSLIVMPRSLLFNWHAEVKKFAPQLSCYTFYGNTRVLKDAKKANLIFITYALMRNEIEKLKEEEFHYIVLDESQNIKNINALTTKAVMLLQGEHRLALSGTPIENNLGELYSLFRFLNPAMFGTLNNFNRDYLAPIQKNNDKNAIQSLRKKIYPFVLRRLKKDVLDDLPDKIEQTLFVEMTKPQKQLYEQRRMFYQDAIKTQIAAKGVSGSRFFVFQALNELRQIASIPERPSEGKIMSPKRELLHEQLMDCIANGHKALVFVNYLAAIELICEQLDGEGIDYVSMSGSTRDRQSLVQRFQTDPNCRVFIMTLKTGGTGLNLTAADTIFIFDPWWNVAAESQAIDRAHRIGQKNKVLAYKLITEGSIEEKIMKLQELKKELFDSVISSDSSSLKSMSEEDIDFILGK